MGLFFRFAFSGFKRILGQYEVSIAVSYRRSKQINTIEAVTGIGISSAQERFRLALVFLNALPPSPLHERLEAILESD